MVTYTVMKNYVTGNWEFTFITLKKPSSPPSGETQCLYLILITQASDQDTLLQKQQFL